MRLSVIVPVYNVEPYVERCLRSLQNQELSPDEYEIIVTNDGSPDNSRAVVERLQQEYDNIILINQENQGVSMARNNAITRARGKYILPIDPDDYVLPNTLKAALDQAKNEQLDILYLHFTVLDVSGERTWETHFPKQANPIEAGVKAYFSVRGPGVIDPDRSWAVLYRKSLLDQYEIDYPRDVPYLEDGLFLVKINTVAQRCGFSNQEFYQRTTRPGSATNSRLIFSEKAIRGFILAANDVRAFASKFELISEQQRLINHAICKFVVLPITSCIGARDFKSFRYLATLLKAEGFNHLNPEGCEKPYNTFAKVYNVSIYLFVLYYFAWQRYKALKRNWK